MPTINIQHIGTGKDHTNLVAFATWFSARDLVANDEFIRAYVHESGTISGACIIAPKTFSKTHGCLITPAIGMSVNELDKDGSDYGTVGIELTRTIHSSTWRISHGVAMEGFRVKIIGSTSGLGISIARDYNAASMPNGVNDARFAKNRVLHQTSAGGGNAVSSNVNATGAIIEDNLFFGEGASGFLLNVSANTLVQRNTFVGRGIGINRSAVTNSFSAPIYRDNVFHDCGSTPILRNVNPINCVNNYTNQAIEGTSTGFVVAANLLTSSTDARPVEGSSVIGKATEFAIDTIDLHGAFRGKTPDVGALMREAAPLPVTADATITSIVIEGQTVTVSGTFVPTAVNSSLVQLIPAATPNGAVLNTGSTTFDGEFFTARFTNVMPGNYEKPSIVFTNAAGSGLSLEGKSVVIPIPPVPGVTIVTQSKATRTVTVTGDVTGYPTSGTITLPAAAGSVDAVTQADVPISILDDGTFSVTMTSVPAGNYDAPIVTVRNFSGTSSATGTAVTVYALGSQPPGKEPAIMLPAYQVPLFNRPMVRAGKAVTSIKFTNLTATAQTNVPFTVGQPFKQRDLTVSDSLIGKVGITNVPLQFNVKATHPDGSVRHGIISGILPAIGPNETLELEFIRSTDVQPATQLVSAAPVNAGFNVTAQIVTEGVTFTASPKQTLLDGVLSNAVWLNGPIAADWIVNVPFKDVNGNEHPDMTAQFSVRYYQGTQAVKVDVAFEHTKAYAGTGTINYDATITVAGTTVYSKVGIAHVGGGRWMHTSWWNSTAASSVHIQHNTKYFIESKAVPNFDQRVVLRDSLLNGYVTDLTTTKFDPMKFGRMAQGMGATGARPEIGLVPEWTASTIISGDKRAKDNMMAHARICAGSWTTHLRDNSGGPGHGLPLSLIYFPYAGISGTTNDAKNPATGQTEHINTSTNGQDVSHQASMAYVPYLMTGDFYFLEELQFWATWNVYNLNPGYRKQVRGILVRQQVRGVAWSLRTLAEAAAITPDTHLHKMAFRYWLDNNLANLNAEYTDNPNANKMGAYTSTNALVYNGPISRESGASIGNYQDDFFAQSIGHAAELGFPEAKRLLQWKAKYQVGRMIAPGVCWNTAAFYALEMRPTSTSPFYESLAECVQASMEPGLRDLPCNSPEYIARMNETRGLPSEPYVIGAMTGYPYSATGFGANYQPGLSMCIDSGYPDGIVAWEIYETRSPKQDYSRGAQFAVVPRLVTERVEILADGVTDLPKK